MSEKFPSSEKLKSKILIDRLFSEGKSIKKYPVLLLYLPLNDPAVISNKTGVSVPKRNFKKAVERNFLKRLMREAFRKNKYIVENNLKQKFAFMFIYTSRTNVDYDQMSTCISGILKKLLEREDAYEKSTN